VDGLPYLSNFACLPGRAGGTPVSLVSKTASPPLWVRVKPFPPSANSVSLVQNNETIHPVTPAIHTDSLLTNHFLKVVHYGASFAQKTLDFLVSDGHVTFGGLRALWKGTHASM
jgi:hypothetical protein